MPKQLGVIMDPIESIHPLKDSTFAMLLEAQRRGYVIHYFQQHHLFFKEKKLYAQMQSITVTDDPQHWFDARPPQVHPISSLDILLMRKDPPVDAHYLYTTYLLEHAEAAGVRVINRPKSLRDVNEKLYTLWFPDCCPPTLVSSDHLLLRDFLSTHHDIICKPLDGMGGRSIYRLQETDFNISVVFETLTHHGIRPIMAQRFIPEIADGDKRILLINGEPVPFALARIPATGETRGNLAAGGHGMGVELSARDRWICKQVGPTLQKKGLIFVGLDVIGDYLTEINVTSPTCIRELDKRYALCISAQLFDAIEETSLA